MRGTNNWYKEVNRNDQKPQQKKDMEGDDSYFGEDFTQQKTSAIGFARNSNILQTNKYGLPVPASVQEEEDPLDSFMREIEYQAKEDFTKTAQTEQQIMQQQLKKQQ